MKKRFAAYILTLALLFSLFVLPCQAEPLPCPDTSGAVSVLLYNLDSDSTVFSKDADKSVYPAATVKIMVALIAIEYFEHNTDKGLDTKITIPAEVIREAKGLHMELKRNEVITARDLIAGMVIAGANDAAYALALAIDGSIDVFLERMNQTAKEYGMQNTEYFNVTGLDEEPCTTAEDLLILGKIAFSNSYYMELAGTDRYTVPQTNEHAKRTLYTRNYLLSKQTYADYYYAHATGMNAGATDAAGYCIVASARVGNQNYLCIVMGAPQFDNFRLAKALFEWVSITHGYRTVLSPTDILGEISIALGGNSDYITVIPKDRITCFLPLDLDLSSSIDIRTEMYFTKLTAPVKSGMIVGEAVVYLEGEEIARVDLVTSSSLARNHSAQLSRRIYKFMTSSGFLITMFFALLFCIAYVLIKARIRYNRMVKQIMEVPQDTEDTEVGKTSGFLDTTHKENH